MTAKPDLSAELRTVLDAFIRKHPEIAGLVACGINVGGSQYLISATAGHPRKGVVVEFNPTAMEACLCEGIAWGRSVARQMQLKRAIPATETPLNGQRH